MNDVPKVDLRKVRTWLSGEVEIRLPRGWLVAGAALVILLVLLALD